MWISFLMKETSNPDLSGKEGMVNGSFDYGRRRSSNSPISPDKTSFDGVGSLMKSPSATAPE